MTHREPAHDVGQDLGVSVEQPVEDTGDPHADVALEYLGSIHHLLQEAVVHLDDDHKPGH